MQGGHSSSVPTVVIIHLRSLVGTISRAVAQSMHTRKHPGGEKNSHFVIPAGLLSQNDEMTVMEISRQVKNYRVWRSWSESRVDVGGRGFIVPTVFFSFSKLMPGGFNDFTAPVLIINTQLDISMKSPKVGAALSCPPFFFILQIDVRRIQRFHRPGAHNEYPIRHNDEKPRRVGTALSCPPFFILQIDVRRIQRFHHPIAHNKHPT